MTDAATSGQVVGTAAQVYDEFFVPALFGQWPPTVLDAAAVESGHRVLDIGCGTGVLARAAAARVGPAGAVVGVDPNPGMLAVAEQAPEPISWVSAAAEDLPFDDSAFDRALSQFALMFFADPALSMREVRRVLKPGGLAALAVWGDLERSPGYAALAALVDELFGPAAAEAIRAPFSFADQARLRELMEAQFVDVEVSEHVGSARFPSIEAWMHTEIRGWTLADQLSDTEYERLVAEAKDRLASFAQPDRRVEFPIAALIATGHSNEADRTIPD